MNDLDLFSKKFSLILLSRTPVVPCRTVQRKSQVLLSTLQKLKEDLSPYVDGGFFLY